MLNRQKTMLYLVDCCDGELSRLRLVKIAFLLRHESCLQQERTFYDFVPYRYGPFSFALYRDMELLAARGFVAWQEDRAAAAGAASDRARRLTRSLSDNVRRAVRRFARKYGRTPEERLLRDVYARYPWFASRSERDDLRPASVAPATAPAPAIYTIGYQGRSVDGFFDRLLRCGIRQIMDVRRNPISRKYGFAKKSMSEIARRLDLSYRHVPELGIASASRRHLSGYESYRRLLDGYERELARSHEGDLARLSEEMGRRPTALVCLEADAAWCHRGRLANALARFSGLGIVHL